MMRSAMSIHVLLFADRGRGNQFAVRGDAGHLYDRDVEVSEGALPDHLRDVREMQSR